MPDVPEKTRGKLISEMDKDERPREKALTLGFDALSDAELLAILFGTGLKNKSVVEMSEEILSYLHGHISRLVKMTPADICRQFKGIGPAKALTLLAAVQLGMRASEDAMKVEAKFIQSSSDIAGIMRDKMMWLDHEEFRVLFLSQSNELLYEHLAGKGGLNQTAVDVRAIIKQALQSNAASIVLVHNHPSGNLHPSAQDKILTKKIKDAAALFDIRILDHVIVSPRGWFSFHDEGEL